MPKGLVVMTVPEPVAQRITYIGQRYELTPEQVVQAAVAALTGMLETKDDRALRFMRGVSDNAKAERDLLVKVG